MSCGLVIGIEVNNKRVSSLSHYKVPISTEHYRTCSNRIIWHAIPVTAPRTKPGCKIQSSKLIIHRFNSNKFAYWLDFHKPSSKPQEPNKSPKRECTREGRWWRCYVYFQAKTRRKLKIPADEGRSRLCRYHVLSFPTSRVPGHPKLSPRRTYPWRLRYFPRNTSKW